MGRDTELRTVMAEDVESYKKLLAKAHAEIEDLREKVGTCSTTILNTVMAQEAQETEVKFLRARVSELEAIIADSDKMAKSAADVINAMQGAMNRMQETIERVASQSTETLSAVEVKKQISELERAAASTRVDTQQFADYQAQIAALKSKVKR